MADTVKPVKIGDILRRNGKSLFKVVQEPVLHTVAQGKRQYLIVVEVV